MAKDLMATAAITARRRLQRLLVHPVGRRPSSNSRRMGSPAAPTGASAGKPGRPRRHQHNKIEIAKKGTRFGSLSHLLQSGGRAAPDFRSVQKSVGEVKSRTQLCSSPAPFGGVSEVPNANVCIPSRTPADFSADMALSGSSYADTINSYPARAACFADLRDHAVRLMKRRDRHGLGRCCDDQGKGNSDQSDHCFLPCDPFEERFLEG